MEGISGGGWEENRPDLWISVVCDGESVRVWWCDGVRCGHGEKGVMGSDDKQQYIYRLILSPVRPMYL